MNRFFLQWQVAIVLSGCVSFMVTGCTASGPLSTSASTGSKTLQTCGPFDHSHAAFDRLLKRFVKNGLVNYHGLLTQSDAFYAYLQALGAVDPASMYAWSREQQMAYWINAYNAFTIQAVVERYPITERSLVGLFFPRNSILQISGIWNRLEFNAGGQQVTLGQIEHEILREAFDDPRIHFAIVCASTSCPALRAEAYRFDIFERQLHEQTIAFINDPKRGVRWDKAKKRLYVSKIFKWFKTDFQSSEAIAQPSKQTDPILNPVVAFIRPYLGNRTIQEALASNRDVRLSYLPYDWHLNEQIWPADMSESSGTDG
jgi:hypothetical protein